MKLRVLVLIFAVALIAAACGGASTVSSGGGDVPTSDPAIDQPPTSQPNNTTDPGLATRPVDGTDAFAVADLTVVVTHPDEADVTYRISCLGDTATIDNPPDLVDANQACSALLDPAVATRLIEGAPPDQVCTEIYGGPDAATIQGTLAGQEVSASVDRVNGCGIFDWDEVLRALLPPPRPIIG